jgi:hypothetical protein
MVLGFSSSFLKAALPGFTSCTDRLVAVLGAAADQQQQVLMHHLAILTTLEVICQVRGQGGVPPRLRSPLNSSVVPASCSMQQQHPQQIDLQASAAYQFKAAFLWLCGVGLELAGTTSRTHMPAMEMPANNTRGCCCDVYPET